jgi:hypothetical protein
MPGHQKRVARVFIFARDAVMGQEQTSEENTQNNHSTEVAQPSQDWQEAEG